MHIQRSAVSVISMSLLPQPSGIQHHPPNMRSSGEIRAFDAVSAGPQSRSPIDHVASTTHLSPQQIKSDPTSSEAHASAHGNADQSRPITAEGTSQAAQDSSPGLPGAEGTTKASARSDGAMVPSEDAASSRHGPAVPDSSKASRGAALSPRTTHQIHLESPDQPQDQHSRIEPGPCDGQHGSRSWNEQQSRSDLTTNQQSGASPPSTPVTPLHSPFEGWRGGASADPRPGPQSPSEPPSQPQSGHAENKRSPGKPDDDPLDLFSEAEMRTPEGQGKGLLGTSAGEDVDLCDMPSGSSMRHMMEVTHMTLECLASPGLVTSELIVHVGWLRACACCVLSHSVRKQSALGHHPHIFDGADLQAHQVSQH